jgi:predicted adenine nucleotide alpha hydrolase (AANH) superfamily ATPase
MRLEQTAKFAAENGYEAFTTTLLISPYQNHELIVKVAEETAKRYEVRFLYRDFRPLFREGQDVAREKGFYMQKYCGCIFSEEERYRKQKVIV